MPIHETLTPERIAELRQYVQQGDWFRLITDDEMLALLAVAEENATLRAEVDDLREQVAKLREFVEATVCTCTSHPCRRCSLIAATAPKEATS